MLQVHVRIDVGHRDSEILASSLRPDDLPWARCRYEAEPSEKSVEFEDSEKKGRLVIEVDSRIESVIAAVDDFMVNLKAAVSVLEVLDSLLASG